MGSYFREESLGTKQSRFGASVSLLVTKAGRKMVGSARLALRCGHVPRLPYSEATSIVAPPPNTRYFAVELSLGTSWQGPPACLPAMPSWEAGLLSFCICACGHFNFSLDSLCLGYCLPPAMVARKPAEACLLLAQDKAPAKHPRA